jgi:hypothetical protein
MTLSIGSCCECHNNLFAFNEALVLAKLDEKGTKVDFVEIGHACCPFKSYNLVAFAESFELAKFKLLDCAIHRFLRRAMKAICFGGFTKVSL